ncbi:hypothetical protein HDU87_003707 [Geranomyces variabilis]|uniref:AB hydrolase-1 domain-containing protein n=1 Tax=Geranomyces variabilis TaxID=109894 RepID=A0AAD5TJ54_9FUNG|nr:hypothetical protein HDU87_003707 [Geranomyces variabilis]
MASATATPLGSSLGAAAPPRRTLGFRAWQLVVAVIVSVTPLAYLYVASLALYLTKHLLAKNTTTFTSLLHSYSTLSLVALTLLSAWMLGETLWYPYHLYTANRLRARRDPAHVAKTPKERRRLYERCLAALAQGSDVRKSIEGWFFGAPIETIGRENMVQWFAWAMWDAEPHDLTESETLEISQFIADTERAVGGGVVIREGFNPDVKCMRLTIDDMQHLHRPFVYYVVISAMHGIAAVFLRSQGFVAKSVENDDDSSVPQHYFYRPAKVSNKKNDDDDDRDSATANSPPPLPIVFIHGIGIGYLHYATLIARLPTTVDVFLIDWPHVAMRRAETIPTIPTAVASFTRMLTNHNHTRGACFVGHSLGSAAISWMLHHNPALVASAVFLDPVAFLLVDPSVAYNFVYRPPTTVLELLMHYFVARELYIAHSLARHFNWSQNILFREELPGNNNNNNGRQPGPPASVVPTCVVLSAWDQVVPSAAVRKYLAEDPRVDLCWVEDMTHGQMMFDAKCMDMVKGKIERACGLVRA